MTCLNLEGWESPLGMNGYKKQQLDERNINAVNTRKEVFTKALNGVQGALITRLFFAAPCKLISYPTPPDSTVQIFT
ncbi:hypothetical protein DPMN_156593 [Dreissena polymorpha]|uniref:Uncharacterized protein n=1 Tax=Dreissena polymorpha TaxID=45954 RepID=A0A9D4J7Q2_DREPO|nr:hypothetical protein DPMN_156593 [Dreissena polymorpha]